MTTSTSRLGLSVIQSGDSVNGFPAIQQGNMNILDSAALSLQGTLANQPLAANVASGTLYKATDLNTLFYSDGSTWHSVGQTLSGVDASRPTASSSSGCLYHGTDSGATYFSDGSTWSTIDASKGFTIIPGSESTSSASYTTLTTPDQISNLVVPANAILEVWYQAIWQSSAKGGQATLFLNGNQVVIQGRQSAGTPGPGQMVALNTQTAVDQILTTWGAGLYGTNDASSFSADVATGQILGYSATSGAATFVVNSGTNVFSQYQIGGPYTQAFFGGGVCGMFLAAGTYTVSIRFACSIGSVTVKNRRLYARVVPF